MRSAGTGSFIRLLGNLKERNVFRVAVAYVVLAWLMMQIGEVTFEALQLPDWSLTLLIVMLVLGFPVALLLSWAYDLTPRGIVPDPVGQRAEVESPVDSARTSSEPAPPSVAVLMFEDMSPGHDLGYLCEGLAEEILYSLDRVPGLKVAPRMASFRFGSHDADLREVGRRLGVDTVLEGSVRATDERCRIAVRLVGVRDGYDLWSHAYDLTLADVLEIEHEVAGAVTDTLRQAMERPAAAAHRCRPAAHELVMRGTRYLSRQDEASLSFARELFARAAEEDSTCTRARSYLAFADALAYLYFEGSEETRQRARTSATEAVRLAPGEERSHVALGIVRCLAGDFDGAEGAFRDAFEINPGCFDTCYSYARCKVRQGRPEEAVPWFERAAALDPKDFQSWLLMAGQQRRLGRATEEKASLREGLARARRRVALSPDDARAWSLGAFALLRLGQPEEARDWMKRAIERSPRNAQVAYNAACFHALAGEVEEALTWLERSLGAGTLNQAWLENDPDLDGLRDDPRFRKLAARFPA